MALTTSIDLLHKLRSLSDAHAWESFVASYEPFIGNWLRRHGLDEHQAKDVQQDVMCVLVRELDAFQHNGNTGAFRTWLRRVTANQLRSFLRKQSTATGGTFQQLQNSVEALERDDGHLAELWEREHTRYLVKQLLDRVAADFAPQTLAAFEQQVFEERSASEVAETLQMSKASVITAKSRVLRRLKQHAIQLDGRA